MQCFVDGTPYTKLNIYTKNILILLHLNFFTNSICSIKQTWLRLISFLHFTLFFQITDFIKVFNIILHLYHSPFIPIYFTYLNPSPF